MRLVRDRTALLRLLFSSGRGVTLGLALAMVAATLLPAFAAAATGWLVGRVTSLGPGEGVGEVAWPLAVVGVLLFLDLVAPSFLEPWRDWVAMRVNGVVRARVRRALTAPAGVEHLDDQTVRDAANLPIDNVYLTNLGAGAEGQLWLMARLVGAAGSALLIAQFSPLLAVFTLVVMLAQRSIIRRQYVSTVSTVLPSAVPETRIAAYWSELLTSPAGGREARLFGFDRWAVGEFRRNAEVHVRIAEQLYRKILPRQWRTFALSALGGGVPFAALAMGAADGSLSPGRLAAALGGVVALFRMGTMGYEAFSIEAAVAALPALETLDRLESDGRALPHQLRTDPPAVAPMITFDDVTFGYPGHEPVLRNFTLELRPGDKVAIVGENGVGKTTLIKLLCGFYVPDQGQILIDGVDLRDLPPEQWRRQLAVIFQEFVHFELSAADNVGLASIGVAPSEPDLKAAADAAGATPVIAALPRGWATVLSSAYTDGVELSGGQWQRVALTRALFAARSGSRVLVLDEPTASLDVHAETALFDQLLTHAGSSTAVVISHRLSTVRRAQRIVVIADGAVAEDGSHDELLARGGRYATMFRLQADRYAFSTTSDQESG